jgi:DNA modification methylase
MTHSNNNSNRIITHRSADRSWAIHHGDINKVLPTLPPVTFDGAFFDPPYGLNFMGHKWDGSVPPVTVFQGLLRLCKPGAYLLAFGGPRTFHRLACNIEDAGWEIRDTLCWIYGDGFPKSHNISKAIDKKLGVKRPSGGKTKAIYRYGYNKSDKEIEITTPGSEEAKRWDGYGTALKPAWEPIILAMKPVDGTFAENALTRGNGGLNIDECRIGTSGGSTRSHQPEYPRLADGTEDRSQWARSGHGVEQIDKGRWPASLILDEQAAVLLDEQYGTSRSSRSRRRKAGSDVGNGKTLNAFRSRMDVVEGYDDEGGASRFFYCAKANSKERQGNGHPTVKPLALCEYLARLILQPKRETPRRLLVPYSGSGSEMIAALSAGWDHVTGIEWHEPYVTTARRRLPKTKDGLARPA